MNDKPYLYHIFKIDLKGNILYPLNQLKQVYPDVYKRQAAKYEGREHLMKQKIPILNCLWNDVVHLSPVHPSQIKSALEDAGCKYRKRKYWCIDAHSLKKSDTVIYLYESDKDYAEKEYIRYDPADISRYSQLPQATKDYYKKCADEEREPLLFHRVPHILYKGTIKVTMLKTIEV